MRITEEEIIEGKELESYLRKSMQFEYCQFKNCDFTSRNLSGFSFLECEFIDCDLSAVEMIDTGFKEVRFTNCKLMGLRWDQCKAFLLSINFNGCKLDFSSFYQLKLSEKDFTNCSCLDCDFAEADCSACDFGGTDLAGATFDQTNLENADFSGAQNLVLIPEKNKLKGARFDRDQLSGLLDHLQIVIN
ncbi:pentapeptide repeat-containing protein [Roseivirga sp.]|uniref:pentapeptide repeat-containing protein n=1 Tax=Roseivirga sp. TaxID=1964215 RepID=UPI003B51C714